MKRLWNRLQEWLVNGRAPVVRVLTPRGLMALKYLPVSYR